MRSEVRRTKQSWARNAAPSAPNPTRSPKAPSNVVERQDDGETRLGPYEARYDIILGYGVERPIITG